MTIFAGPLFYVHDTYTSLSDTDSSLIRSLLLVTVLYIGITSPELRILAAKGLRMSADLIEPKDLSPFREHRNPKNFKISNPFYHQNGK